MIEVKNKLEIMPGNVIRVPGCEPVSSLTGTELLKNMDCNASIIPLEDALELIPGSRIIGKFMPAGHVGTGLFFELPSGPPPDGNACGCSVEDYYKILRENAKVRDGDEEPDELNECSGFNFSGCQRDQHHLRMTRDPALRPNSNPISAGGIVQA
jgi:hypothetical protein